MSEIKLYFTFYNLWKKNGNWKLGRTSISTTEPSLLCASYLTTGFMEFIFCPISRICVTLLIIKKWSRSYLSRDLLFYDLVMKETNYDDDNRVEDDRNNAIHVEFHYFIRYDQSSVCCFNLRYLWKIAEMLKIGSDRVTWLRIINFQKKCMCSWREKARILIPPGPYFCVEISFTQDSESNVPPEINVLPS